MNQILPYKEIFPKINDKAFIAPGAFIVGDVTIGVQSGIWFNCVLRGDVAPITIGNYSNVQDGSTIHATRRRSKTTVGSYVTIGHNAIIHGAEIHDYGFVGMGAILLDNSVIESFGMLAAGSVLTSNKVVKSGELWAGNPAKFFRLLTAEEKEFIKISAENYRVHTEEYNQILDKIYNTK